MNETLEKRKTQLLKQLNEDYANNKPTRWWQSQKPVYKTTWEYGNTHKECKTFDEEIIIRYNQKGAVFTTALLFCISVWMLWDFLNGQQELSFGVLLTIGFFGWLIIGSLMQVFDRRPKITLNAEGIWLHQQSVFIYWEHLVASYIKEDSSGEDMTYHLILHHYDPLHDEFVKTEYKLQHDLDACDNELAYYIEYWKIKTSNLSINPEFL